jgi:hypothetical protein
MNGKTCYDGDWMQDKFHGFGVLYNKDIEVTKAPFDYNDLDNLGNFWEKYEGNFIEDVKEV